MHVSILTTSYMPAHGWLSWPFYNFERIAVQRGESLCVMSVSNKLHRNQEVFVLLSDNRHRYIYALKYGSHAIRHDKWLHLYLNFVELASSHNWFGFNAVNLQRLGEIGIPRYGRSS